MAKKPRKTPPAKGYLVELVQPLPTGDRCPHESQGFWLVEWNDILYTFDPPTQIQKDIWLSDSKKIVGEETALGALRWCCRECGTVQKP